MSDTEPTTEEIALTAKSSFDLKGRLQGRLLPTGHCTVFTDQSAGNDHTRVVAEIEALKAAVRVAYTDSESGEILIPAVELDEPALAVLEAERDALGKELERTALTFNWRAVPPIVDKDAARRANSIYAVNGVVPKDKQSDHEAYFLAYLLSQAVTTYIDHQSNTVVTGLTLENAQALDSFLPVREMLKLNVAFAEVQYPANIAHAVTDTPDF